jgi:hypothetical protein
MRSKSSTPGFYRRPHSYEPIVLRADDAEALEVIAELVEVLPGR